MSVYHPRWGKLAENVEIIMTESTKNIITTMEGEERCNAVKAMVNLLEQLKELYDWNNNKIEFTLDNGNKVEIKKQDGNFEIFYICSK